MISRSKFYYLPIINTFTDTFTKEEVLSGHLNIFTIITDTKKLNVSFDKHVYNTHTVTSTQWNEKEKQVKTRNVLVRPITCLRYPTNSKTQHSNKFLFLIRHLKDILCKRDRSDMEVICKMFIDLIYHCPCRL